MLKIPDYILIASLLLFAIFFNFFFIDIIGPSRDLDETDFLVVTVKGEPFERYPLSKNGSYMVATGKNDTNTFEINDGVVAMVHATCPDQLCVNFKPIEKNTEFIFCLPNEVYLEIYSEDQEKESEIDSFVQ